MFVLQWQLDDQIYQFRLEGQTLVIGRSPECDIQLNDDYVSRQHAQVYPLGGESQRVFIRNLSSSHAIHFKHPPNLAPLDANQEAELYDGSTFLIGRVLMKIIAKAQRGDRVVCAKCEREISAQAQDCPWCGANIAFAQPSRPTDKI